LLAYEFRSVFILKLYIFFAHIIHDAISVNLQLFPLTRYIIIKFIIHHRTMYDPVSIIRTFNIDYPYYESS